MADLKYGRLFTLEDVQRIVDYVAFSDAHDDGPDVGNVLADMESDGKPPMKFPADEPLFLLRAQDKRAIGAVRFYSDHQSPRAPMQHIERIDDAVSDFESFRLRNPERTKEPD